MRVVRRMLIRICHTTMLNYSQITNQLSIRGGRGGGRWRIDHVHGEFQTPNFDFFSRSKFFFSFFCEWGRDTCDVNRNDTITNLNNMTSEGFIWDDHVHGEFQTPNFDFFSRSKFFFSFFCEWGRDTCDVNRNDTITNLNNMTSEGFIWDLRISLSLYHISYTHQNCKYRGLSLHHQFLL